MTKALYRRTADLLNDADEVGSEHMPRLVDVASAGDKCIDCWRGTTFLTAEPGLPTSGVRTHVALVVELGGALLLFFNDLQKLAWIGRSSSTDSMRRVLNKTRL